MSFRSTSPVQHIADMTETDSTFKDENKIKLVVGPVVEKSPTLIIEDALKATIRQLVNDGTVSMVCELRTVRKEQDDGKGPVTGLLRKMVMSKDGKLVKILFDYFPAGVQSSDKVDWDKEFCVNPTAFHESSCVAISMQKRMHCICGISKESLA